MGSKSTRNYQPRASLANLVSNSAYDQFELLSRSIPFLTREQLESYYECFLHDYPKGFLKLKDFKRLYSRFDENYGQNSSTRFCKFVFNAFDENNDRIVSFDEYIRNISVASFGTHNDKLRLLFRIFDINKNNRITKNEVQRVIKSIYKYKNVRKALRQGHRSPGKRAEALVNKVDKNLDKNVTIEEFIDGLALEELQGLKEDLLNTFFD